MQGQADLFSGLDASTDPAGTKADDQILIRTKARRRPVRLDPTDPEEAARRLEATGDYRVLRRLKPRPVRLSQGPTARGSRLAIIVDTETTGLAATTDEVIELGMVAFTYDEDGRIGDVTATFSALREPSLPISPEITRLTGITPEMVAGQRLDLAAVERFVAPAELIIAHNARFDRPFCERLTRGFAVKAWACSHAEIPWSHFGFEGSKLGYLVAHCGWFHQGHRAVDDCHALLEVLASPLPGRDEPPFGHLLASARKTSFLIWAEGAPYAQKEVLRKRGYRWNDGTNGRPKSWWTQVDADACEKEILFLQEEVYRRELEPFSQKVTAFERFRTP